MVSSKAVDESSSGNASSARTASLLILLQFVSRLVTFSLNQALLSFTTPAAFGTATIHLEPLLNTVLFLSREGIRNALIRFKANSRDTKKNDASSIPTSTVLRLSLIPLALGVPLSIAIYSFYIHNASESTSLQPYFQISVILYALSTCLELLSEPYFNRAQVEMDVKLRVSIEGAAVVVRALTTLAAIVCGGEKFALLAFGLGQLAYATTLVFRYWWHYGFQDKREVGIASESTKQTEILRIAYALTKQSLVKQVLTEGDKVIVSRISPVEDQGGYGLALNYGSLVARIIFQPLEESSRLFYSQNLGELDSSLPLKDTVTKSKPSVDEERKRALVSSAALLKTLLMLQVYLTLVFTCFGPYYVHPLLYHLLGSRSSWLKTSAPNLLQQYLFLLPVMGVNGILEAFVQAVANEKQLGRMSMFLLLWSGIYCVSCFILVKHYSMMEEALIWSNGISMLFRSAYSMHFIKSYFSRNGVPFKATEALGSAQWTALLSLVSALVIRWGRQHFLWQTYFGMAKYLSLGIGCFLVCLASGLYAERQALRPIVHRLSERFGWKSRKEE